MIERLGVPALAATILTGVWLLAAPFVLPMPRGAELSHLVAGPVIASVATVAVALVARPLARANLVPGAWLAAAPLVLDHGAWWWESLAAGVVVSALALVPHGEPARFGGGWRALVGRQATDAPDGHGRT